MRRLIVVALGLAALAYAGPTAFAASGRDAGPGASPFPGASWGAPGGDLANSRYSTLTQITPANVKNLKLAWSTAYNPEFPTRGVQTPPTVVGNTLFVSSSRGTPAALDAATGKLLWNNDISTRDAAIGSGRGLSVGDGMLFAGQGTAPSRHSAWRQVRSSGRR